MKKYAIVLLKIVLLLIAIAIIALSVIGIISLIQDPINPIYGHILYPIVIAIYLSTVLIYMAFYQTYRFLKLIEDKLIFSNTSIHHLKKIKWCGLIFAFLYLVALPFFYLLANADDAPGVIFVGMIPLVGGFIVYLFAEIMIKITDEGIELK
ncbi:MAG: DUF2975 domain-containing protein [Acholeplasmataceae bacterium]|nr:DUF2975 domain-containing protein [Acholeplasmataceae bacterium]